MLLSDRHAWEYARSANRRGGRPRGGGDLLRRAWSGEAAVPVGPLRQFQRPELLLGTGIPGLGWRSIRHDGYSAYRPRGQLLVFHGVSLCFFGEKKRTLTGS